MTCLYTDPAAGTMAWLALLVPAAYTQQLIHSLRPGRTYSFARRPAAGRASARALIRKGKNMHNHIPLGEEADDSIDLRSARPPGGYRWTVANPEHEDEFRDLAALGLGRYLRATRLNEGLSYDELSRRARVDRVTLIALELGLLPPEQIRRAWLDRLAGALGEKPDHLALLLGIPLPRRAAQGDRTAHFLADIAGSENPDAVTIQLTYHSAGWRGNRERYRAERSPRDPDRLYFDK